MLNPKKTTLSAVTKAMNLQAQLREADSTCQGITKRDGELSANREAGKSPRDHDLQTQKGSLWNEMWRMEAEKALLSVPGKVSVQVPCHVQNNLNIFRYFGRQMEKLGTVPAASWFKNNDQVLFRFSVYLSWFLGELLGGLELRDLGKLMGKEGIKR